MTSTFLADEQVGQGGQTATDWASLCIVRPYQWLLSRRIAGQAHLNLGLAAEALREGGVAAAAGTHRVQLVDLLRQRQQLQDLHAVEH